MESLKRDRTCAVFNAYRTASVHIGDTVVRGGASVRGADGKAGRQYIFVAIPGVPHVPDEDVLTICVSYSRIFSLWSMTPSRHSFANWTTDGTSRRTISEKWESALTTLSPKLHRHADGLRQRPPPAFPIRPSGAVRSTQTVGCQLNPLFDRYLGKTIQGPDDMTP